MTLTGPGGVGKTRLVVAIAQSLESSFPDGACWIDLAGVSGATDVGVTVTRALGVTRFRAKAPLKRNAATSPTDDCYSWSTTSSTFSTPPN